MKKKKKKKKLNKLKILLIILFLINIVIFGNFIYKKYFYEEKNLIYCVGGEELEKEINLINGMKCYILKFDYELMKEDFYEYLLYNHTETMICNFKLNDNECNYYDDYFYTKQFVNDSNFVGYVSEFVGIRYDYFNDSEMIVVNLSDIKEFKKTFFDESEEVDYEEGYRRIRKW